MKSTMRGLCTLIAIGLLSSPLLNAAGVPDTLPDPDGKPADMTKPVKVFILMGQSNMLGFGKVAGGDSSLEAAVKAGKYPYLVDEAGAWTTRQDVRNVRVMNFKDYLNDWMSGNTKHIGPELGIGHYAGEVLDAPVLILKSCIGNRSLGWDLLPPGSEPYEFGGKTIPGYRGTPNNPKGNGEKVQGEWYAGKQYDDDVDTAKQVLKNLSKYYPGASKYEVAGFCFWQGAKDGGSAENSARYEKNLVAFIKALRKDFDAPDAVFVVSTMGHGKKGSGGNAGKITDAQLAVDGSTGKYPEFKGNVATFYANPVSMGGSANGHYSGHAQTYMNVGEGMGKALATLLVNKAPARAEAPAAGTGRSTGPKAPPAIKVRTLAAGKDAELDRDLKKMLSDLSAGNALRAMPIPLSFTSASISLSAAKPDGLLTFLAVASGKRADIPWSKLSSTDKAKLAVLVTKMVPDSASAHAIAGVYMESLGKGRQAQKYYESAGPTLLKKYEEYFE